MTVSELGYRMSSWELAEWSAYEKLHGPLDLRVRVDIGAGIVASTIANANSKKGNHKPHDFIPVWYKPPATEDDMLAKAMAWNSLLGGTVEDV